MHLHSHHRNIRNLYTSSCFKNARLMIAPSFLFPSRLQLKLLLYNPAEG